MTTVRLAAAASTRIAVVRRRASDALDVVLIASGRASDPERAPDDARSASGTLVDGPRA